MMNSSILLVILSSIFYSAAFAQTEYKIPEITVMGQTPAQSAFDFLPTVSQVAGKNLEKRKQVTLGETLSKEAGVSSSFFGPNASRPVIRGLDGDRIRMLENGIGILDASGASPDHAVSIDPLLIESIEVIRGPSALLYGTSAVGGVVNVRNGRIAEKMIDAPELRASTQYSTVDQGRSAGAVIKTKLGKFVLHADGMIRGTEDYAIPGFARTQNQRTNNPLPAGEPEDFKKVTNSANRTRQGALGGSYIFDDGYLGLAFSGYNTQYGTVVEKAVRIQLNRYRLDLAGEAKNLGWLESVRYKIAGTTYQHQEFELDQVGTTFKNDGIESRVDAKHRSADLFGGQLQGMFGLQQQFFNFSAIGDEAFLPTTQNSLVALFAYEELKLGDFKPSVGARVDSSGVKAFDDAAFGPGTTRTFWTPSASLGLMHQTTQSLSLSLNGTYTERAPNYQEIFANGPHVATGAFEVGNRNMDVEKNIGVEVSARNKTESNEARFSVFFQSFKNFISLSPTGNTQTTSSGATFPEFQFQQVKARLYGAEFEFKQELPFTLAKGKFDAEFKWDMVRGENLTAGGNLPRIPPMRETVGLSYRSSRFNADAELQRVERQTFTAANETQTRSYTLVNGGVGVPIVTSFGQWMITGRVNNIFDHKARNHVSQLKEIAPLPGRNFIFGLQASL